MNGYKMYPGHGKRFIKLDGRTISYLDAKCQRSADLKRNPREICWTVLYRRKHKKGQQDQEIKKKNKRTHRVQRAFAGASLLDIIALRNQKPETRAVLRDQAIKNLKDSKRSRGYVTRKRQAGTPAAGEPKSTATKPKNIEKKKGPVVKAAAARTANVNRNPKNRTQR